MLEYSPDTLMAYGTVAGIDARPALCWWKPQSANGAKGHETDRCSSVSMLLRQAEPC